MTEELTDAQARIESYLVKQVRDGNHYFKSKRIAEALELSAKSVGVNIGLLQERSTRISIECWAGRSSGTTWRVDLDDPETCGPDDGASRLAANAGD